MIEDNPIAHISEDKFGREPIVGLIVDSINALVSTDHSCMVYGIYGKWGEGKTSLMNFVKERLLGQGKDDGINIVEFNPWLVNNDEALFREFFSTIMSDPEQKIKKAFQKYGSLAIYASKTIVNAVIPSLGTRVAEFLGLAKDVLNQEDTLYDLKKKASEAIKDSGRHLVIIIDDVDRLDKEELHSVLRLIRQVADFDNCIYIVAMDVDMVAKSISDYHGNGSVQDGRKFLDKIVQVPITLPVVPTVDMFRFISQELSTSFDDLQVEQVEEITKVVIPFIGTYRDLKRYCNQMKFVYPHLKGEVNTIDLFLLEAIKMANAEAYQRIHECRSKLMHESCSDDDPCDEEKAHAKTEQRYQEAKAYVTAEMGGQLKETTSKAIDILFDSAAFNYQDNIDNKRLLTNIYFNKFYTLMVPSDVIPDRKLEEFKGKILELETNEVVEVLNAWAAKYSAGEVKRAAIYVIRKFHNGEDRCRVAEIIAKAMSVCSLAKGIPPHIFVDSENLVSFVPVQIIAPYMFFRDRTYGQLNVYDSAYLDDVLTYIFENAEMNFCLNMLCSCDIIFGNGIYSGSVVLPLLFNRFRQLDFDEQIKYSKLLLQTIFKYWHKLERDSFNEYAIELFSNPEIPYLKIFDKLIDGTDDRKDVVRFVELFSLQIPVINDRLLNDESITPENHHSVQIYTANYAQILKER